MPTGREPIPSKERREDGGESYQLSVGIQVFLATDETQMKHGKTTQATEA
jgi:hypothetical protein